MDVHVITYNMGMGIDDRDADPVIDSRQDAFNLFAEKFSAQFNTYPNDAWFICVQEIHRKDDETDPTDQVEGMKDQLEDKTTLPGAATRIWYKNSSTHAAIQQEAVAIFSNYDLTSKDEWSLPGGRTALAVEAKIPSFGKIGVVVTHLTTPGKHDRDGNKREKSIQTILTKINRKFGPAMPVILCGDMNVYDATPAPWALYNEPKDGSRTSQIFEGTIGKVLEDGYTRGKNFSPPPQEAITYHAWDYPDLLDESWGIFDYILVREVSCIAQTPVTSNFLVTENGVNDYASDHKGVSLTIIPGKIEWGDSDEYDTGSTLAVALNNNDTVVEVHRGASAQNKNNLYYKIGKLNDDKTITWKAINGSNYKNDGFAPAVALNDNGTVVEVHCDFHDKSKHYYKIGQLDTNKKKITWGDSVLYDSGNLGSTLAVALDNSGNVIEMHCDKEQTLFYRVGKLSADKTTIDWNTSVEYVTHATAGALFGVALDYGRHVVAVHSHGDGNILYRVGTLEYNQTITWYGFVAYETGSAVAIALNNNWKVVEVHCGSGDSEHTSYYRVGTLRSDYYGAIDWGAAIPYDYNAGSSFGVALNNNGKVVEVHRGGGITTYGDGVGEYYNHPEDTHLCRVGQLT